jgi:23S rRNA (guanosine2251-2'-O)-methyltransferase
VKTEIIYGFHPVLEALRAGRREFFEIYVSKGKTTRRIDVLLERSAAKQIPVKKINPDQLKSMAGSEVHQGIGAKVSRYPFAELADLLAVRPPGEADPLLLIMDSIVDPHNLGALIRTASCVDVAGIILPKDRSAHPTPAVSKASAGALEHVALVQVANLVHSIVQLKKAGFWVVGMDKSGDRSIFNLDLRGPIALIVGGEQKGIRPLVRKNCDHLAAIPQRGPMDSLNVSVAGGVALYEIFRQREFQYADS